MKRFIFSSLALVICFVGCKPAEQFDVIIENGIVYDGSGEKPLKTDIGIVGKRIEKIGNLSKAEATLRLDANGKAVAPGFINVLSWGAMSLWNDGRSMSNLKQGVTLEIFGEGKSPGPVSPSDWQKNETYQWRTLGEFLDTLTAKGLSCNVASFVGATTVRKYVLGERNETPTESELTQMRLLVEKSMKEGALGVGSSLIYPPAFFAQTNELVTLAKAAAKYDGIYISHIRSEGDAIIEAVEELITIAREASIPAEIYHLKAAGKHNWHKLDTVLQMIDQARADGLEITTNMYTYEAASTGLGACFPPWVQEGGSKAWVNRLQNPELRQKVAQEMRKRSSEWENFYVASGTPENILLLGFDQDSLRYLNGKSLEEAAWLQNIDPVEMAIELIIRNDGNVSCAYFLMDPENVKRKIKLPYMSFGSDAGTFAAEGKTLESSTHPRAYGNFARLLGKYVREEQVIPLEEAIYKLTYLPAKKLHIDERGLLKEGYYADITIFDPETIADLATFENPHQYSVGVSDVFVNGTQVLKNGEHTGAMPGMAVRGRGYVKN